MSRPVVILLLLCCALAGCTRRDALDDILERGELTVVTRNSPTTYYQDRDGANGFEYALATRLAAELGVNLQVQTAFSLSDVFRLLERGEADVAAAGLTLTGDRGGRFPYSTPYSTLRPQVVYKAGNFRPRDLEQLAGLEIAVLEDSSHVQSLEALREGGGLSLTWREIPGADSMEILEAVESGRFPVAIVDSNEFRVQQSLYPRLKVAFDLGSEQEMVWYLSQQADNDRLLERINGFLNRLREDGALDRLREEHFGHIEGVSRIGSHTFNRNMHNKLPQHRPMIQQVAAEFQMDWRLLAAIAYQESHWNPSATSPTGVRGMMMLTILTAQEMGVENRLDPRESLRGGARYYRNIKRRLPNDIVEPDRTWLALAAYNIGMGHLEDARVITERHGGDPHLWQDVMVHLPLLQKPAHYQRTRYGFARGQEAVTYVQNIRHYYSILEWQDIPDSMPQPPVVTETYLPATIRRVGLMAL
jgi:membrane-bound lytic murein transglycosylase F